MADDAELPSRYVAIGDSTTEGLGDPAPGGRRHVGFADRLAGRIARERGELLYANLGIRGRKIGQIRAEQLEPALAMNPDLVTVVGGINDILRPRVDLAAIAADFEAIVAALRECGAAVIGMTYVDPARIMPAARGARHRVLAFNERLREIAARHGASIADLERRGVVDRRLWSVDRLHANPAGHARIAAAMSEQLGLEPDVDPWAPLPPADPVPRAARLGANAAWAVRHMAPWVIRRIRGRSSGDDIEPKRPALAPVGRIDEGPR